MLPIAAHAITVEIEKKDARKHQCGPKGYCTVTDFTERLAQPRQKVISRPEKTDTGELPTQESQNKHEEKKSLGRGEDIIF